MSPASFIESTMETRDLVVKTHLNEPEFLAFKGICQDLGLSQSAVIRRMIKNLIRATVEEDSARSARLLERTNPGHD